jgi:hypothetical protein
MQKMRMPAVGSLQQGFVNNIRLKDNEHLLSAIQETVEK